MSGPSGGARFRARPEGLLFDLGNTLLREEAFDGLAGTLRVLALAENPRGVSVDEIRARVAEVEADLRERRERAWMEMSPWSVHRLVYEPLGITFRRPFEEVELEFLRGATRFAPTEGVEAFVGSLASSGLPLGVVSNSMFTSESLALQLEAFGLRSAFRFVMSSADYVVRKPHPAIFRVAAEKLGTEPARTWYVGDNPRYDVAGAANAGMVSVLYRPDGVAAASESEPEPDLHVRSWAELQARLGSAG